MSPKLADLDSLIETLRQDTPSPAAISRAQARLQRRPASRSSVAIRLGLSLATAAAVAFILWPRESAGAAWARTLETAQLAPNLHSVSYSKDGTKVMEIWRSGRKRTTLLWAPIGGALLSEQRFDGKRRFNYFNFNGPDIYSNSHAAIHARRGPDLPNARRVASIGDNRVSNDMLIQDPESIDQLLQDKRNKLLDRTEVSTPDGPRTSYSVQVQYSAIVKGKEVALDTHLITVLADKSGKVRGVLFKDGGHEDVDYPTAIDPDVFDPTKHFVQGVEVHDRDAELLQVQSGLRSGIARKQGVNLHFLALDAAGNLWALWTGAPAPDGKLSHPFRVVGIKSGPPFGLSGFTTNHNKSISGPSPITGTYLGGMALPLQQKIGDRVTIEIPNRGRYVRFESMPVMRISSLYDFEKSFGFKVIERAGPKGP